MFRCDAIPHAEERSPRRQVARFGTLHRAITANSGLTGQMRIPNERQNFLTCWRQTRKYLEILVVRLFATSLRLVQSRPDKIERHFRPPLRCAPLRARSK